jgi:hypothetical protein
MDWSLLDAYSELGSEVATPSWQKPQDGRGFKMKNTFVLAFDPFTEAGLSQKNALKTTLNLAEQSNASLRAVTVISTDRLKVPVEFDADALSSHEIVGKKWLSTSSRGAMVFGSTAREHLRIGGKPVLAVP